MVKGVIFGLFCPKEVRELAEVGSWYACRLGVGGCDAFGEGERGRGKERYVSVLFLVSLRRAATSSSTVCNQVATDCSANCKSIREFECGLSCSEDECVRGADGKERERFVGSDDSGFGEVS